MLFRSFITELGHEKTERLHLHGIVWGIGADKLIEEKWNYGITFTGYFVNEKTINYITKYMTKEDVDHPEFIGKVLCSKGIGAGYTEREDAKNHVYKKSKTIEYYRLRNGSKINLPTSCITHITVFVINSMSATNRKPNFFF